MKSKSTVMQKQVDYLLHRARWEVHTEFEKCTVVTCKLPNGFVITESSACVDPANYDLALGKKVCLKRIREKVWELEEYRLQYERAKGAENRAVPLPVIAIKATMENPLAATIPAMLSPDYKDRFRAEARQLEYRIKRLSDMLLKCDLGQLDFELTCPEGLLQDQLDCMKDYYHRLLDRAKIEEIEL